MLQNYMRNFLWVLVVVVILGGGYVLWQNNSTPATSNTETPDTTGNTNIDDENAGAEDNFAASVAYSEGGFSPGSVTVRKGQTVRFLNTSDENTWPASVVHPTHGVYPEKTASDCLGSAFDACRGLIPGEMWDFTFNQVGEWKYHDHLHPSKFGSITVSE